MKHPHTVLLLLALPTCWASTTFADDTPAPDPLELTEWKSRRHILGITYEVWRNHSLGLRYMHAHESGTKGMTYGGFMTWASYGVRPRVVLGRDAGNAIGADLMGAFTMFGHTGGLAAELALGGLNGADGFVAVGSVGLLWSMLLFDIGYVLQLGTSRPDWLSRHQLGIRINIPFKEYTREETTRTIE